MSYLILNDYYRLIQDVSLNQLISGNKTLVSQVEQSIKAECISYLVQKYDTSKEFADITIYNPIATYKAGQRVYIDAPAYNSTKTYTLNSLVLQGGYIYLCKTAITVPEVFTSSKWTNLGLQYSIFYAIYPDSVFDLNAYYNVDDKVFYNDAIYTCLISSRTYTHDQMIQFSNTVAIPYINVFPDDKIEGSTHWLKDSNYTVSVGKILDTTYFTLGDNRNQQLLMYVIDMVVYRLYQRIPPQIIPQPRVDAYRVAISWLQNAAKGDDITADLTLKQPTQGSRIRWGSGIKQDNSW